MIRPWIEVRKKIRGGVKLHHKLRNFLAGVDAAKTTARISKLTLPVFFHEQDLSS